MIEKILSELRELPHGKYTDDFGNGFSAGINASIEIVQEVAKEYGKDTNVRSNGWIPVETELPTDCDNRFYECIVENHEEDLPMFCQYEEEYGFGFWHDYYDGDYLGFIDSEFKTNEELGYEKVIAWKQIAPYKKGE